MSDVVIFRGHHHLKEVGSGDLMRPSGLGTKRFEKRAAGGM
jgi:hypothetical protein